MYVMPVLFIIEMEEGGGGNQKQTCNKGTFGLLGVAMVMYFDVLRYLNLLLS